MAPAARRRHDAGMNVNHLPEAPGPTLRQLLAFQGIECSTMRERRNRAQLAAGQGVRRERREVRATVPGIEVTYLPVELVEIDGQAAS